LSNFEIIGISGKAGSGKDFVGRTVLRPAGFHQWAFAWPMKMLALGQGATYEEVFETKPPRVREMLQKIGTEEGWMKYGKDYWLKQTDGWLKTLHENLGINKFYFTDVRFPHEFEWVKNHGGAVVRLVHGDRAYPLAGTPAAEHSSETALDDYYRQWDLIITNDSAATPASIEWMFRNGGILPPQMPPSIGEFVQQAVPITRKNGVLGRYGVPGWHDAEDNSYGKR
jgi:hypothetical protein